MDHGGELVHQIDDIEEPAVAPGLNAGAGDADGEMVFASAQYSTELVCSDRTSVPSLLGLNVRYQLLLSGTPLHEVWYTLVNVAVQLGNVRRESEVGFPDPMELEARISAIRGEKAPCGGSRGGQLGTRQYAGADPDTRPLLDHGIADRGARIRREVFGVLGKQQLERPVQTAAAASHYDRAFRQHRDRERSLVR